MRSTNQASGQTTYAAYLNALRADAQAGSWLLPHQLLGTISNGVQPTNTQTLTLTINGTAVVFTFVTSIGAAAGNVLIGATASATIANLLLLLQNPQTTTATGVALSAANITLVNYLDFSSNGTILLGIYSVNNLIRNPQTTFTMSTTTGMTLTANQKAIWVESGIVYIGATRVSYLGGVTPTFIDPVLGELITLGTNPSNNQTLTLTINATAVVFTFVTSIGATAGNVLIGASAAATVANLLALLQAPGTTTANGVALTSGNQTLVNYLGYMSPTTTTINCYALNASLGSLTSITGSTTATSGTVATNTWNRIDLVTMDNTGTVALVTGIPAAAPAAPAYPLAKTVLAEVTSVPSQTGIYDNANQQTSQGYVSLDVRQFIGGAYIASDSQVDAAAAIQFSKLNAGAINVALVPDGDGTRNLGSGSFEWNNLYVKTAVLVGGVSVALAKFGGTGADGALSISSGTTTTNVANIALYVKNYTSISITGTGKQAFSTPNTNGTVVILRSQGAVTITSSTVPAIDVSNMGAAGGTGGASAGAGTAAANNGGGGASAVADGEFVLPGGSKDNGTGSAAWNPGTDGTDGIGFGRAGGGRTAGNPYAMTASTAVTAIGRAGNGGFGHRGLCFGINWTTPQYAQAIPLGPGGGGGGGGGQTNGAGGNGGAGSGSLYIQCAGALNVTSTLNANGTNGVAGASGGGGGGGGGGGQIIILYFSLTANTGTFNTNGGTGGGGTTAQTGGNGGAGMSYIASNNNFS